MHGDGDGALVAHQDNEFGGARHTGVEQVALQHHVVLRQNWNHHHGELRALRLVDAHRVGMDQFVQLRELVTHQRSVEVDGEHMLLQIQRGDAAHVAVEDLAVVVVANLHHAVAHAEDPRAMHGLGFARIRRVESLLQAPVQLADACRAPVHRAEHLDVAVGVVAELRRDALRDDVEDEVGGALGVVRREQEEIPRRAVAHRHLAAIDAVRVDDDVAILRLAEDRIEPRHRDYSAGDEVAQHVPRPHRRQLIHIAHQQEVTARLHGLEQVVHQQDVHHGRLIHDDHIRVKRIVLVARKAEAFGGFDLQQPVDRLRFQAGRLAQTFGGAARRRAQQHRAAFGAQQLDNAARDRRLACAGAAREDADFLHERHPYRCLLLLGQMNGRRQRTGGAFLKPVKHFVPLHITKHCQPVAGTRLQLPQLVGDGGFGIKEGW